MKCGLTVTRVKGTECIEDAELVRRDTAARVGEECIKQVSQFNWTNN